MLFIESSICTVCTYSDFFLVYTLYSSGLQILPLIADYLRFRASIDIAQFQFLVTFLAVFFLYIITYFQQGTFFICGFWVFRILVYSIQKNPNFNCHLIFPAIFLDLEKLQLWYQNYIFQICNLYFYFRHVGNFWEFLYLSVFSK